MKKRYPILVTNYDLSIWPLCMLGEMLVYHFHQVYGVRYPEEQIGEWKNRVNRWATDRIAYNRVASAMLARAMRDPAWAWHMARHVPSASRRLLRFTSSLLRVKLSHKTDAELCALYARYREEFIRMYTYAWFPNALEGLDNIFTKTLTEYAIKMVGQKEAGKCVSTLTTPLRDSIRQREEKEFLSIVQRIQGAKHIRALFRKDLQTIERRLKTVSPATFTLLRRHHARYCWIPFDYDGPAWDFSYFLDRARGLVRQRCNPAKMLLVFHREREILQKQQREYARLLNFRRDRKFAYLFALAREILYLKDYRKDALFQSYYHADSLIREIGRRLALSSIQVKHILPQEMRDALVQRRYDPDILNTRIQHAVLLYTKKRIQVFVGEDAERIMRLKTQEKRVPRVTSLTGDCAYAGCVRGVVRLVCSTNDIQKMREGDILVSPATNPNLMPALRLARAIVTDKGGLTCHAAIISREMKKPCVIGTKIATGVLHDGDVVEVDAENGIVRLLRKS